jgi:hypothetical protein
LAIAYIQKRDRGRGVTAGVGILSKIRSHELVDGEAVSVQVRGRPCESSHTNSAAGGRPRAAIAGSLLLEVAVDGEPENMSAASAAPSRFGGKVQVS